MIINYEIKDFSHRKFFLSPFTKNKFPLLNPPKTNLFESLQKFQIDIVNRECWFMSTNSRKYEEKSCVVEIKQLENSVHPFEPSRQGPFYDKYSHVINITTEHMIIYGYLKLVDTLPKRIPNEKLITFARNSYLNNFRIIKVEDRLLNLTDDNDEVTNAKENPFFKVKRFRKFKQDETIPFYIVYDCETISINGKLRPFMIYAYENAYGSWFQWTSTDDDDLFNAPYDYGSNLFTQWLADLCSKISDFYGCEMQAYKNQCLVRLFGFNNYNFDNHFLYEPLRQAFPKASITYKDRYGKTTSCTLVQGGFTLSIVDLIRWFPATSLSTACKNFQIPQGKLEIDIIRYCQDCSAQKHLIESTLTIERYIKKQNMKEEEYVSLIGQYFENSQYKILNLIKDYCKRDVEATEMLYNSLQTNVNIVIREFNQIDIFVPFTDIFCYISPPQLAFTILKSLLIKEKQPVIIFKSSKQNEFNYESYMGGRTDYTCIGHVFPHPDPLTGLPGEYLYVDVTSEYPTVMKGNFPDTFNEMNIKIGSQINIDYYQDIFDNALEERNRLFFSNRLHEDYTFLRGINSFKAILRVNIFSPTNVNYLSTWSPVGTRLIQGNGSSKLYFLNHDQFNRVLNTWHIAALILAGWRVEIVECENNILFTKQAQLLKSYVDIVGEKKTQAVNNKSLRNLLKLLMNSLYGKLAQKPTHLIHTQETVSNHVMRNDKVMEVDWNSSYHYLSTFITSAASFIIFDAAYKCELQFLYMEWPIEARVNIVIYCDTDSLIVNKFKKSSFVDFLIDEKLGEWSEEECRFIATWKYETFDAPIASVIILSKKTYCLLGPKNEILSNKSKGVHSHIAAEITFSTLKSIAAGNPLQLSFPGLTKHKRKMEDSSSLNISMANNFANEDFVKDICEAELKKTLTRDTVDELDIITPTCLTDMRVNQDNLLFRESNLYKNYLVYTSSSRHENIWRKIKERERLNFEESITETFDSVLNNE